MLANAYHWTDRLTLWEAAPLAEEPTGFFAQVICNLGIPEALTILAMGVIVGLALQAIKQQAVGTMAILVSAVSAAAILATNLAAVLKGVG